MHLEGPFISPHRLGAHPQLNLEPRGDAFERVLAMRALRADHARARIAGRTRRDSPADRARRRRLHRPYQRDARRGQRRHRRRRADVHASVQCDAPAESSRPRRHRGGARTESPAIAAVIPDGVHVHPEMLRLVFNARGKDGLILVTDKVALAGTTRHRENCRPRSRDDSRRRRAPRRRHPRRQHHLDARRRARRWSKKPASSIGDAAVMAATNPANLIGPAIAAAFRSARSPILSC